MPWFKRQQSVPTADEILATLGDSALRTIVVEGANDVIVFRNLERVFQNHGISVMPVHGRDTVLKIFARRNEIPGNRVLAFIADRDTWCLTGIPNTYVSDILILTNGYSVENDLLVEGKFEELLTDSESEKYREELSEFLRCYSVAVARNLEDKDHAFDFHPNRVLDDDGERLRALELQLGEDFPIVLHERLRQNYRTLVRGKSLLQLLFRQLGKHDRKPRQSSHALLEYCGMQSKPAHVFEAIETLVGKY